MRVTLDYGRTGMTVELPDARTVGPLAIRAAPALFDPEAAIAEALAHPIGTPPLATLARGRKSACILVCDVTRPVPNRALLPPLLRTLEQAGLAPEDILILVATGLHRPNEGAELAALVGPEVVARYRVGNHHGKALDEHVHLGETPSGTPIWIDARYLRADLKIATGLIEPHLMAGYSGGRKVICPGIAALETVRHLHGPRLLEDPRADCGVVDGNPVHEEATRIARAAGCDFIVDVCLDEARRITWVGAGDLIEAWEHGVRFLEAVVRVPVARPVDVVVTSAGGAPLDATWYQSIKGLTGALPIVAPGGTIVMVAELAEGIGSAEFQRVLADHRDLPSFKRRILGGDYFVMDQWQLEEQAKVVERCTVRVVSDGLSAEALRRCFVEPAASVEQAVAEALAGRGPQATVAVIPKGPYVLPYVAGDA